MRKPTIAAVVVNYNYARFLPAAVDSLLEQHVKFDEVFVVDDGSTDDSLQVLAPYRDRVTVLEISNRGQLGACRIALAASSADYVYFLDADDLAMPQLVQVISPLLINSPAKVQFQLKGFSNSAEELHSIFPTFPEGYDASAMRADNDSIGFYICPPTSGNVYSREVLAGLPLEAIDQRDSIDGPPALALPYVGEIASLPVPLARYRLHGSNLSQWSEPTPELLTHEIEWFHRRWIQVIALIGGDDPRKGGVRPMYVAEREAMVAALRRGALIVPVARLMWAMTPTNLPVRQKLLLTGWALGLILPSTRMRRSLVRARRSPLNRSRWLRRFVRLAVRNGRQMDTTAQGALANRDIGSGV